MDCGRLRHNTAVVRLPTTAAFLVWQCACIGLNVYLLFRIYPSISTFKLLLRPDRGAEYWDQFVCLYVCRYVCLSASISLELLDRSGRNFVGRSTVAVARSSTSGVTLRYVLPVLWMTSRLALMGVTPKRAGCTVQQLPWAAWRYWRGVWCLWMPVFFVFYSKLVRLLRWHYLLCVVNDRRRFVFQKQFLFQQWTSFWIKHSQTSDSVRVYT